MTEVQLSSTCLVEEFFGEVSDCAVQVLERLGLRVLPIKGALCCGQIAFNEGFREEARTLARRFLDAVRPGMPIVVPSGSCASMLKVYYGELLAGEPALRARAAALRPYLFEFSQFLVGALKVKEVGARFEHAVAYHPSCHLLRELRVIDEPRLLLSSVRGIKICELGRPEECCGFGGLFAVKFPEVSAAMLDDKVAAIRQSGADTVVANDCGCLMQIGGGLHRAGCPVELRHLAQVLASR
jgi:L-lactate dehydrogenase complex protein LldE